MSGYEHGYTAGHEDGLRQGWAEAREEHASELEAMKERLNEVRELRVRELMLLKAQYASLMENFIALSRVRAITHIMPTEKTE
jgi:flagellar biosynthesis/type III secretory pathway protein FliH